MYKKHVEVFKSNEEPPIFSWRSQNVKVDETDRFCYNATMQNRFLRLDIFPMSVL